MPLFSKSLPLRPINQTHVSKTAIPDETHNPLEYVTNATAQVIEQMGSLICKANDLFKNLGAIPSTSPQKISEFLLKIDNYNPKVVKIKDDSPN